MPSIRRWFRPTQAPLPNLRAMTQRSSGLRCLACYTVLHDVAPSSRLTPEHVAGGIRCWGSGHYGWPEDWQPTQGSAGLPDEAVVMRCTSCGARNPCDATEPTQRCGTCTAPIASVAGSRRFAITGTAPGGHTMSEVRPSGSAVVRRWWPVLAAVVVGFVSPVVGVVCAAVMAFTQRRDRTLTYWLIGIVAFWVLWFSLLRGVGGGSGGVVG